MKAALYKPFTRTLARILGTPQYIILFLSDFCWMKCNHCWFNESWKKKHLSAATLSLDELSRMAEKIERILFLSLTGGEAFTRPDVVEIAQMFAKKVKLSRYQIPTSGFDPDMIVAKTELLLRSIPDIPFRVDVSLDGTEAVHERVRGVRGGYRRVLESVIGLNRLKRRFDHFDVGIITTISSYNEHEVQNISDLVARINPGGEWMVNVTRGETRDPKSVEVDPENYFFAHTLIKRRIEQGLYRGHRGHASASWLSAKNATRRKLIKATLDGTYKGGGCAAGSLGAVIYSDGTVKPCEMLDRSLGNIREFNYDLRALWNSRNADAVRDWIQDTRCHCTQECFLSVSLMIQPQHWPDIVRERLRLAVSHWRRQDSTDRFTNDTPDN
jgi:radical SAM protein with 4Fe4S-binding SPASM domain